MPTLFDQTWQDNAGDTVSASDLNSHAAEHSNALFNVEEGGTVIGGVGRDQPINITGSGASVSKSNGEIVVDVTDTNTDTRVETQAGGTQQYADTSAINFDTSSDISVTDDGSGQITVAASGGGSSVDTLEPTTASTPPVATESGAMAIAVKEGGSNGQTEAGDFNSIAIGNGVKVTGGLFGIGRDVTAKNGAVGAIGNNTEANGDGALAIDGDATSDDAVALGARAESSAQFAYSAFGGTASQTRSMAIQGTASAFDSISIGDGAEALVDGGIALGFGEFTSYKQVAIPAESAFTDADLYNKSLTFEPNSNEDGIVLRYKDSNGTVKTGTVNIS